MTYTPWSYIPEGTPPYCKHSSSHFPLTHSCNMRVAPTTWRGRPAYLLEGDHLSAVVACTGGHLAALWDTADPNRLNPLWQPHWPTGAPEDAATSATWGSGPEAALLTNIVGSNLCCDRFGAPHPGEERPLHGEGGVSAWTLLAADGHAATFHATLPLAGLIVNRTIKLLGPVLTLTTRVEQRDAGATAAKSIEWCEHTTLGGAFLEDAVITAGVDACREMPPDNSSDDGAPAVVPVEEALAVPAVDSPPQGSVRTCRLTDGHWCATNPKRGYRLSASFSIDEFPWLCLWTEHSLRTHAPWGAKGYTRGMEISTKPFPEGKPPKSREVEFLGRPTTCIIPPSSGGSCGGLTKVLELRWERL